MRKTAPESGFTILETLFVVALIGVIATIAIPQLTNSISYFRLSGDARSVSNSVAVAKMRAASKFAKTRLYVNVASGWFRVETANTASPPAWTADGGVTYLNTSTSFSTGGIGSPPPSTQSLIGQATECRNSAGATITGTACVVFNSRGIPIAPDTPGTTYSPTAQ